MFFAGEFSDGNSAWILDRFLLTPLQNGPPCGAARAVSGAIQVMVKDMSDIELLRPLRVRVGRRQISIVA